MEFDTWQDDSGRNPVAEFRAGLDSLVRAALTKKIEHYEVLGIRELRSRRLLTPIHGSKEALHELKFKLPEASIRMLCLIKETTCLAMHAFFKKDNGPIKPKEVRVAANRARLFTSQ